MGFLSLHVSVVKLLKIAPDMSMQIIFPFEYQLTVIQLTISTQRSAVVTSVFEPCHAVNPLLLIVHLAICEHFRLYALCLGTHILTVKWEVKH